MFDLDGTLADTAADLMAVLNRIIADDGLDPISIDQAGHAIGQGASVMIERAFALRGARFPEPRRAPMLQAFLADYERNIAVHTRPAPGVVAAIDHLSGQGARMAICTNKTERLAKLLIEKLALAQRFAAICGRDTFEFRKPDPRHLISTVEMAGGDPGRAVMVGDSRFDITAAQRAGIPVIAVDFGYSDVPVHELKPDAVISHFDQLAAIAQHLITR